MEPYILPHRSNSKLAVATVDMENFGVKKISYSSYFNEIKHTRFFTMKILLSNNYYHAYASSIYSGHSCMLNLSNKTYTMLKHSLRFIIVLHRVHEDGTVEVL